MAQEDIRLNTAKMTDNIVDDAINESFQIKDGRDLLACLLQLQKARDQLILLSHRR
jgi:hypothetical protein